MLRRRNFWRALAALIAMATASAPAYAWGNEGHQIVALIAESRLAAARPDVLKKVRDILGTDMHNIATCPDVIRVYVRSLNSSHPQSQTSLIATCGAGIEPATVATRYPASADWHFINLDVPLTGTPGPPSDAIIASTCASQKGCAPQKIQEFEKLLASSATPLEKRDAIIFLVHLTGDLHQPLHSAVRNNDAGGNSVLVVYGTSNGQADNLHHVWDDDILDNIQSGGNSHLNASALASLLVPSAGTSLPAIDASGVNDWARESYEKAVNVAYASVPDERDAHDPFTIDFAHYQPAAEDVVTARLTIAGERLAGLLVTALGGGPLPSPVALNAGAAPALRHPNATEFLPSRANRDTGCQAQGRVPDPGCTPGAVSGISLDEICGQSTQERRDVTEATKKQVLESYGLPTSPARGAFEIDHFIPLELGGSNDVANLWPQPASPTPGFHEKDKVENFLHAAVCKTKTMSLPDAQRAIATDWLKVFNASVKQ